MNEASAARSVTVIWSAHMSEDRLPSESNSRVPKVSMKTITQKQFRILLDLSIATLVASTLAVFADPWLLPQSLRDYENAFQAQRTVQPKVGELVLSLLGVPGPIAAIISFVGLYRFSPWARWLNVAAWVYMLVLMPFSPVPVISNALAGALSQCSTLLSGVVLAIIYFSPAASWFQRKEVAHDVTRKSI
jgi:hypothetical protein